MKLGQGWWNFAAVEVWSVFFYCARLYSVKLGFKLYVSLQGNNDYLFLNWNKTDNSSDDNNFTFCIISHLNMCGISVLFQ